MKTNQQLLKVFVVLFFGTAFIFSFSHYGAKAFGTISNADGKYSEGTTIGTLDVAGKTEEEAMSLLEQKFINWVKESSMELQYGEISAPIDLNEFHLDAKQTIDSIKDGQKNTAFISIEKQQIGKQVELLFPQVNSNDLDLDKLTQELNQTASQFEAGSHSFNLYNDYLLASQNKDASLNTAIVNLNELPIELQTFIDKNPKIEIKNESTFSLLELVKKQNLKDPYSLDVLATGIYQAVLPTNISIIERNISSSLPEYVTLGYEAKVNESRNVDLVLANPNKTKYTLELRLENEKLMVTLKGQKFTYTYKVSTKDGQKLKPKTIVQYSPLLLPGKTKVQTPGVEGQVIKVYRDVYQGEAFIKSELISEDYYPPTYQVEIHGLGGSDQETRTDSATTSSQVNDATNSNDIQTQTATDQVQQDSADSDLWGKPNEQPK
ncbi:VanW family protein [Neobacillus sp. PS2-9]|uniref:VanW family protein n=1 Tax=Neobacillus sp. PS2-9 TaxID=3070676 RepID=UPI0027E00962|nr:VanW family protein [Neobacillus sp. PS2-9]WML59567.1 VanW family protein [Neobacillus sp. PS2-9]